MDADEAKRRLQASGDIPNPKETTIQPHNALIPSISLKLPVLRHQKAMLDNIRRSLGIADIVSDEQINYQLSWCKWMAANNDRRYTKLEYVKDFLKQQFLSDEGIAAAIKSANET